MYHQLPFRWPCGLRRRSEAFWLLGLGDRNLPRPWILVSCVRCVLCRYWPLPWTDHSFRGVLPAMCVCVCLIVCDLDITKMWPRHELGCCTAEKRIKSRSKVNKSLCMPRRYIWGWVVSRKPLPLSPCRNSPQEAAWFSYSVWIIWRRNKSFVPAGNRKRISRYSSYSVVTTLIT